MIFILSFIFLGFASAIPFQVSVENHGTECFYEKLEQNDYATFSVLIVDGDQLMATMILEGPFAKSDVENTADLVKAENQFARGSRWTQHTNYAMDIDFEHLQEEHIEDIEEEFEDMMEEVYWDEDDDDDSVWDGLDETERKQLMEEKRKKRMEINRKLNEIRKQKEKILQKHMKELPKKVREEGEPVEKTLWAKSEGWYRACLRASFSKVTAELEFRTSKELGGVDPETEHVYTYEKYQELQEQRLLDEDTAENEPSIDVEDFEKTRNQMRELRRVLNQISTLQNSARNRMNQHGKISEHSNSRMTWDSIFVTILFVVITLFQVYTIQRWFTKTTILGR